MHKRQYLVVITSVLLFAFASTAYFVPRESKAEPMRILLPNKGGNVVFEHKAHWESYGVSCVECHHTYAKGQNPDLSCGSCHVPKFDEAFANSHADTIGNDAQCGTCHHPAAPINKFDHSAHEEYASDDCQTCHHDESIEPEPQSCSNCHKDGQQELKLQIAAHTRCAECHEDKYKDEKSCSFCHERQTAPRKDMVSCATCHSEKIDALVPTTAKAFHQQCMGCHEKEGQGPFGNEACGRCHLK